MMILIRFMGSDRKQISQLTWPAVPRIGDLVCVGPAGKIEVRKVVDVLWGTTPPSRAGESCEVEVVLGSKVRA